MLDYAAAKRGGVGDLLWGPLLGMRDELREVTLTLTLTLTSTRGVSSEAARAWRISSHPAPPTASPTQPLAHAPCCPLVAHARTCSREVAPGVLVGLGSMRATGGVRNCATFVLTRAED